MRDTLREGQKGPFDALHDAPQYPVLHPRVLDHRLEHAWSIASGRDDKVRVIAEMLHELDIVQAREPGVRCFLPASLSLASWGVAQGTPVLRAGSDWGWAAR